MEEMCGNITIRHVILHSGYTLIKESGTYNIKDWASIQLQMKRRTELDGHICVTAECHHEANQTKKNFQGQRTCKLRKILG